MHATLISVNPMSLSGIRWAIEFQTACSTAAVRTAVSTGADMVPGMAKRLLAGRCERAGRGCEGAGTWSWS
ncbi:hypothetical protein SRO_5013 [Streptomyces rochei]|nr:hypothetical protein SRO_5013 [Streptomyces rochei]